MKLITRDTDYAIRALGYIAGSAKRSFSVRDLTKRLDMPRPFLRKLLQILTKKEYLRSSKGKGGGFVMIKEPSGISILDLMEIFQGPFVLNEHTFKNNACPAIKSCRLKRRIDKIEKYVIKQLKDFTISDFIRKKKV